MKNRQINKVLLMFFLSFTLFFSVSNAEIVKNKNYSCSGSKTTGSFTSTDKFNNNYTYFNVLSYMKQYKNYSTDEATISRYRGLLDSIIADGNDYIVFETTSTVDRYFIHVFPQNENLVSGILSSNGSNYLCHFYDGSERLLTYIYGYSDTQRHGFVFDSDSNCNIFKYYNAYACTKIIDSSVDLMNFTHNVTSNTAFWDGTYSYQIKTSPSANYDLAGIIDVIKNSAEIQNNVYSHLGDYFIVPNGTVGDEEVYRIYFYHKSVNLSQFEYVYNNVLYYDLDKTSVDGIICNLIDHMNGFDKVIKDVQLFTLYYNPETGTGDIYLTSNQSVNELKSFNSETQPIIYTTKDIAYYSATWGETDTEWTATADETKNILTSEIVDSEGNVVSPVVPNTSLDEEDFWNKVLNRLSSIVSYIKDFPVRFIETIQDATGISQIITVLNPIQGAFWAIFDVLISAVTLISRAVVFVYTLPTIEASRALFDVDVAATEGLSFVGNSWGNKFLEGFDMIKGFSWNGLNLWNLFSAFVVLMVAIQAVKYVRKHYHY